VLGPLHHRLRDLHRDGCGGTGGNRVEEKVDQDRMTRGAPVHRRSGGPGPLDSTEHRHPRSGLCRRQRTQHQERSGSANQGRRVDQFGGPRPRAEREDDARAGPDDFVRADQLRRRQPVCIVEQQYPGVRRVPGRTGQVAPVQDRNVGGPVDLSQ